MLNEEGRVAIELGNPKKIETYGGKKMEGLISKAIKVVALAAAACVAASTGLKAAETVVKTVKEIPQVLKS